MYQIFVHPNICLLPNLALLYSLEDAELPIIYVLGFLSPIKTSLQRESVMREPEQSVKALTSAPAKLPSHPAAVSPV